MSTIDTIRKAVPRPLHRLVAEKLLYLLGRYDMAAERHRSRMALRDLDERLLKDIGLARGEALREGNRAFWD